MLLQENVAANVASHASGRGAVTVHGLDWSDPPPLPPPPLCRRSTALRKGAGLGVATAAAGAANQHCGAEAPGAAIGGSGGGAAGVGGDTAAASPVGSGGAAAEAEAAELGRWAAAYGWGATALADLQQAQVQLWS